MKTLPLVIFLSADYNRLTIKGFPNLPPLTSENEFIQVIFQPQKWKKKFLYALC